MSAVEATLGTSGAERGRMHLSLHISRRYLVAGTRDVLAGVRDALTPFAHPVATGRFVAAAAVFLTRDLGCSASGHDPVNTRDGLRCRRCWRAPVVVRERVHWRDHPTGGTA